MISWTRAFASPLLYIIAKCRRNIYGRARYEKVFSYDRFRRSRPLKNVPEWEKPLHSRPPEVKTIKKHTVEWESVYELPENNFIDKIAGRKRLLTKIYVERFEWSKNKNKNRYIEKLVSLEIVREFIELKTTRLYENDPNWDKNFVAMCEMRYELGYIMTHIENVLYDARRKK